MAKLAIKIAGNMRRNPAIVLCLFVAWMIVLSIVLRLLREDYMTSVVGYQMLPTRKWDEGLFWAVGALPMALQVACGFWAIEKGNRVAAVIALCALVVDAGTDVYFKASGDQWGLYILAIAETLLLFTLGSELLFLVTVQNLVEYFPDAVVSVAVITGRFSSAVGQSIARLWTGLQGAVGWLASGEGEEEEGTYQTKKRRGGRTSYQQQEAWE